MRKTPSAVAAGILAAALAGCASSAAPQSQAAGGTDSAPSSVSATTGSTDATDSTDATTPAAADPTPQPTSSPAAKPTSSHSPTTPAPTTPPSKSKTTSPAGTTTRPTTPGTVPSSFGYNPSADSKGQIAAARAAAKADNREVLLDFGASWCGNCVAMDKDFHDPKVQAVLAASYHLVQIDVDASGSMNLLAQYSPNSAGGYGLPVLIILSPSGATRVDTDKSGNPGFDTASFLAFLKKWAG
ncbi:thioredoxin family protein [Catenulispora subtropica]|uniref:Thioredoxin domain-containing protein n=1 Tax=Catenulispora subtropica TaxID=450798 RepID=A0ABN2REI1_9ACTN